MGTGLQALGWGLRALLLTSLRIPAAWGVAAVYRWYVRNLVFSDGTVAEFTGRGGQVWGCFVLLSVLNGGLSLIPGIGPLSFLFIAVFFNLIIYRWFFRNIGPSTGEHLDFTGRYWPLLGYLLLFAVSIYTLVGWAWVAAGMTTWICRNIYLSPGGSREAFTGTGGQFLWRDLVVSSVAC